MDTTTSHDRNYPREARVIHNRTHPADVENSLQRILARLGAANPAAFTRRWSLEEIVETINELTETFETDRRIRNQAGLLWRTLERRTINHNENGG